VGIVAAQQAVGPRFRRAVAIVFIALAGWNIYASYPALDRSADRRPATVLAALTEGLSERNALLLTDMNWQVQNGLTYFSQYVRPEVLHAWLPDVVLYAPALIRDNRAVGRQIVATERAAGQLDAAYGPLFKIERERAAQTMESVVRTLPAGTKYVLCVLKPAGEFAIDHDDLGGRSST
jgi:hypothetical protein